MPDKINNFQDAQSWQNHYDQNAPKKGDLAPDFKLSDVNGENSVQLSDFSNQRPVVLVFGSFT